MWIWLLSFTNITRIVPSFCNFFLTCYNCVIYSAFTGLEKKVREGVINLYYFSERCWINEYISIPESTLFCIQKDKTHGYNYILFFKNFVLTYVILVISFSAAVFVNSVTLLRWLCLLKMAVLCWKFNWGLLYYAYS